MNDLRAVSLEELDRVWFLLSWLSLSGYDQPAQGSRQ